MEEKSADSGIATLNAVGSQPGSFNVGLKQSATGIVLIPQPSNDPRDPLNWGQSKKLSILLALSVSSFAALGSPLAGLLALIPQSTVYEKTINQVAYGASLALAGMVIGPFVLLPVSHTIGRTSTIFWTTFSVLIFNVWGASMTGSQQYIPFLVSRFLAGFGSTVPSALGPRILMDLFFIHERGRVFAIFHLAFLLGPLAVPAVGCFIAAKTDWPIMFWWTIPLLGVSLLLILVFMEETGYERDNKAQYPVKPEGFFFHKIATFLPGNKVVPTSTISETIQVLKNCLILTATPVTVIIGLYGLISFGCFLMQVTMQATFLLEPIATKGYGFDLLELAEVSLSGPIGVFGAMIYNQLVSDRLPMWICKRRGGLWINEYRLHCMWFPGLIVFPAGLGLFGAAVEYHWHPTFVALSYFMTTFGSYSTTPIITNYLIECFLDMPAECGVVLSGYRLIFGVATGFFIAPWSKAVGVGWTFGTAAFLSIFAFIFIMLLMWKGERIRRIQIANFASWEQGVKLVDGEIR